MLARDGRAASSEPKPAAAHARCAQLRRPLLFNTLDFVVFFAAVFTVWRFAPAPARRYILLGASLYFYGYWDWQVLALLLVTAAANWRAALAIAAAPADSPTRRRAWLIGAVVLNLGLLAFFKYYVFVQLNLGRALALADVANPLPALQILLPIGISFYTFQITSYVVDVYRRELEAIRPFADLLLFIVYFPQLVAGPIERAGKLLPQLERAAPPTRAQMLSGLQLAAWGVFKKVFVADNLSRIVDLTLFPGVTPPAGAVLLAAACFALQVYADFSGYTDAARGVSRCFGVELTLNFNLPFAASNPAEFWRRWHITLGAFLRDYIYIPLGGGRAGALLQARNVLIVWAAGGLWHGASLGFLIWGVYCGALVVLYGALAPAITGLAARAQRMEIILRYGGRAWTFWTFALGLLLFRVESPAHLWTLFDNLLGTATDEFVSGWLIGAALFFAWPLIAADLYHGLRGRAEFWEEKSLVLRTLIYAVGLALFTIFGSFAADQFFYFQF